MTDTPHAHRHLLRPRRRGCGGQDQHGACPGARLAVLQHQPSAMVLHDLLDDGKAKAGSLRLVGDIGLGQAGAFLTFRQTQPVILDHEGKAFLDRLQRPVLRDAR